jgi:hypothetical protein
MQSKVKLLNSNSVWNDKRRYKINAVVTYNGQAFQNSTGIYSIPSDGIDWICKDNGAIINTTTTALSLSVLNSTYPNVLTGFKVYCPSIILGAVTYEKTPSSWLAFSCTTPS